MRKLRVLDLFSGIGGFSLGLERAGGFETVAFCEIEPYPRAVLKKHWPHVPCYDDVRTLTADRLAADGITVDVICGGFPCQDISLAGKGAGLAGERSGLWSEYARLIGELRPSFVIVENVAALLGRGLGDVLGDLAALGYDAEWHCVPAAAVGAPHRRDRVWIVADASQERCGKARQHSKRREKRAASGGEVLANAKSIGRSQGDKNRGSSSARTRTKNMRSGPAVCGWRIAQSDLGGVADGISRKLDGDIDADEERYSQTGAEGGSSPGAVPGVWLYREAGAASSGLSGARRIRDTLPALPHEGGSEGRAQGYQGDETLQGLWSGIHAKPQSKAQHMQPGVPIGDRPGQCAEKMGQWEIEPDIPRVAIGVPKRVDRLKGLGNAVVPQMPELIGKAIMQAEGIAP